MKTTVSEQDFISAFQSVRPDNFSLDGLRALFEYLEEFERDSGEEMELDVIAICCDFSEHKSAVDCASENGFEADADADEEEKEEAAMDYLRDRTTVIPFEGGVIIQDF